MVSKHQRPTQENPQGGIVQTEASIHHSNVMLVDKNKITRVGYKLEKVKKLDILKNLEEILANVSIEIYSKA